jgi:MFS superfamily sulfate permease-like transporter
MGPVAAARARRRRKMQLIALALCAVMMIIFALIMGVLMGIVKLQWRGDDDDD